MAKSKAPQLDFFLCLPDGILFVLNAFKQLLFGIASHGGQTSHHDPDECQTDRQNCPASPNHTLRLSLIPYLVFTRGAANGPLLLTRSVLTSTFCLASALMLVSKVS